MKRQDSKHGRLETFSIPNDYHLRTGSDDAIRTCIPKTRKLSISRADFTAKLSRFAIVTLFVFLFMLDLIRPTSCLSCYVCGGSTGRSCGDISPRRKSPYIRYLFNCIISTNLLKLFWPAGKKHNQQCSNFVHFDHRNFYAFLTFFPMPVNPLIMGLEVFFSKKK